MSSQAAASRACRGCNLLKVRCHPSSTDPSSCERCWRAGKACVSAGKRRRPRDRIAELEAQVADLTKALQSQRLSDPMSDSPAEDKNDAGGAKHKLLPARHDGSAQTSSSSDSLAYLDSRVSLAAQQQALETYAQEVFPTLPAVKLCGSDLDMLRRNSPILLFSVIAFATSHRLPSNVRDDLIQEAMRILAVELVAKPTRRLEVVWALLITAYWFRAVPGTTHITVHQLIQLAMGMAIDLGIGGEHLPTTPGAGGGVPCHSVSTDAHRTWLTCFIAASTMSIGLRRPDANAQWTPHHEECLANLSSTVPATQKERDLVHIVGYEKLCYRIASSLAICDPTSIWDLASSEWKRATAKLRQDIDDWTAQTADFFHSEPLFLYRYSAIMLLNEPVLHTSTNKLTFAAPIRPERLAEADFPSPAVTGSHVTALHALRDACHAMLDVAAEASNIASLAICPLMYIGKIFHALFLLAKLYISVTGPGNTYGSILRPAEVRFEQYLEVTKNLADSVESLNPGSFNARILAGHSLLGAWYKSYNARIDMVLTKLSVPVEASMALEEMNETEPYSSYEQQGDLENGQTYWPVLEDYQAWMDDRFLDEFSVT